MFDLMAEVEAFRRQKKDSTPVQPVQSVQSVQTHGGLRESLCARPVQACAKKENAQLNIDNSKSCTGLHSVRTVPKPIDDGALHELHRLHRGKPLDFGFLKDTPITEPMIWEGFKRWKQPFCSDGLADIYIGASKPDDVIRYLYWWMSHRKDLYQELRTWAKVTEKKPLPINPVDDLQILIDRGLELLPEDRIYIKNHLARMIPSEKKTALIKYAEVWCDAMAKDEREISKQSTGRRAANVSLDGFQ